MANRFRKHHTYRRFPFGMEFPDLVLQEAYIWMAGLDDAVAEFYEFIGDRVSVNEDTVWSLGDVWRRPNMLNGRRRKLRCVGVATGHIQTETNLFKVHELSMPSSDTDDFRRILSGSREIVVIAGAGLSAGSGEISSDSSPLKSSSLHRHTHLSHWKRAMAITKLATPKAFASNPALVWQFYHERRRAYVCLL